MFDIPVLLALIVLVALVFDFTNGAHDCANAIATVVSTKVVTPRFAVGAAALLNLGGALLGTEVAKTLGSGIVLPQVVEGSHALVEVVCLFGGVLLCVIVVHRLLLAQLFVGGKSRIGAQPC